MGALERARAVGCAAACGLALCATGARAQQPGVFIDPSSPAAKEYTLPLAAGRSIDGGGPAAAERAQEPPLFGEGITPASTAAPGGAGGGAAGGGGRGNGGGGAGAAARRRHGGSPGASQTGAGATSGGGSGANGSSTGAGAVAAGGSSGYVPLDASLARAESSSTGATGSEILLLAGVLAAGGLGAALHARASRRAQPRS